MRVVVTWCRAFRAGHSTDLSVVQDARSKFTQLASVCDGSKRSTLSYHDSERARHLIDDLTHLQDSSADIDDRRGADLITCWAWAVVAAMCFLVGRSFPRDQYPDNKRPTTNAQRKKEVLTKDEVRKSVWSVVVGVDGYWCRLCPVVSEQAQYQLCCSV